MTRTSSERRHSAVAVFLAVTLAATSTVMVRPAHAEPSASAVASAKGLVVDGRALRDKGDHKGARDRFKAAYAIVPTPIIGSDLAREHLALGELLEAREVYVEVTKLPPNAKETPEGLAAREDAAKMASDLPDRIPSVVVEVQNAPAGATLRVTLDGEEIPSGALKSPWKANPGPHVLVVALSGKERRSKFSLKEREKKTVVVDLAESGAEPANQAADGPAPTVTPPASSPSPSAGQDQAPRANDRGPGPGTWTALAVGGVGIVVGAITGGMALSKASSVKADCVGNQCPPSTHSDYDASRTLGTVSTIAFAVGIVGVGIGAYGLLTSGRSSAPSATVSLKPVLGLGSIGVTGAF